MEEKIEEKDNNITKNDNEMYCASCGKIMKKEAFVCPHCGVKNNVETNKKSKLAAGIIAIFAGNIGIHKFYLGRARAGVLRVGLFVVCTGIGVVSSARTYNNFDTNTIAELSNPASYFNPFLFLVYIPFLLGLIDGIIFLTMNDDKFDKKYNKIVI